MRIFSYRNKRTLRRIALIALLAVVLLMLYLWIFFRAIEIFRRCGTAFHGLHCLEAGVVLDIFSPLRADFLK